MTSQISAKAGFGFVVIASILFGTTGTEQQIFNPTVSGFYVGAARQVVGGVAMLLLVVAMGHRGIFRLIFTKAGLFAAFGTLLYQITFFVGISSNGVSAGTVVALGSAPIFTAALSYFMLKERITGSKIAVFAVVLVGIWLLLVGFTFEFDLSIGIFASIGAGIGYALYTVNAKAMVKSGVDSTVALAVAFGGAVPIALLLLLTGELNWITEISGWGLAIYLGIVPTAVAYYFFGKGLVALSAATVATITLIEPVVATILALIVVGETLQLVEVAGIVIVIVGLGILSKIENRAGKQ